MTTYPLSVSANGRYLVDQNGLPFMIVGDSPHSIFVGLSEADADLYFADRQAHGFNSTWIEFLCNFYTGGSGYDDAGGLDEGITADGIRPFLGVLQSDLSTPDLTTINPAYLERVDNMINSAAQHGIIVFLDPIDLAGWIGTLERNGPQNAYTFGEMLGEHFKNFDNIIWINGNDYQTWRDPYDDQVATSVALGIAATDTRHIQTVQLDYYASTSLDDPNWAPIISLNAAYTYFPTYAEVLKGYNESSTIPVFMAEANYEFENNTGYAPDAGMPFVLREQEYWAMLSGATGQLYGNYYTWHFIPGWQNFLDTTGVAQLGYMESLFGARAWFELVPDQAHTVVTAGYGTFSSSGSLSGNDYLTAAATPDGTLVIAYMPTARTITVDMSKLSGPVIAHWFDPTTDTYIPINNSPLANSGSMQFTPPPGAHDTALGGGTDWVLVLETAPPHTTAPSAASITSVTDDIMPLIGTLDSGASSNDPDLTVRVSLSGTGALAGETVQLYNGTDTGSPLGGSYTLTGSDISNGFANMQTGTLTDGSIYTLTARITNAAGNQSAVSSNSFTVTEDTTAPTLTPVSNQFYQPTGPNGAVATFGATAADNVDGTDTVVFMEGTKVVQSGDTFSIGAHAITANATDAAGNMSSESFIVTVGIDTGPVLTVSNLTAIHGQSFAGSSLFTYSDPIGHAATQYDVWNTGSGGGHFMLNGLALAANQDNIITAGQLAQLTYQSGSGADTLWVRANDGTVWGAWSNAFAVTAPVNHAPVATASDFAATHNQNIAASSLFSVTDADSDAITKFQFWDSTTDPASGHFVVNGVAQPTNQAIDVTAAQLAQASFQSGSGSDDLWVRANDGFDWSSWKQFHVNAPVNHAPVATASDFAATHNQNIAASSLFSVTDADSDAITKFQFWDSTTDPASGHFVVNGVAQPTNQAIDVTAAQLAQASFQSGSGSDDLWVRANDGFDWSSWKQFHVNAPVNHAPVATASDFAATHNQNIAASSLFSVTDADSDAITKFQFWDSTTDPASGHFVVNGVAQPTNQAIDVTAAQLAQASFQSGSGSDDLWVRANDGFDWSSWKQFHVNAPVNHAPVATASDFAATHNQNIAASSLFSVTDADSDAITKFQFWDSTTDPASGHFVVNGVAQPTNQAIDVTAAQLAQASFQSGSGSDDLWVRANDGFDWSSWKQFHVNAPVDAKPVVSGGNASLTFNMSVVALSLFSVADAENDSITEYQFWDSTAGGGHFAINGVTQPINQAIDVVASLIAQTSFVAASTPATDELWVRAYDGMLWSDWHAFTGTSHA